MPIFSMLSFSLNLSQIQKEDSRCHAQNGAELISCYNLLIKMCETFEGSRISYHPKVWKLKFVRGSVAPTVYRQLRSRLKPGEEQCHNLMISLSTHIHGLISNALCPLELPTFPKDLLERSSVKLFPQRTATFVCLCWTTALVSIKQAQLPTSVNWG